MKAVTGKKLREAGFQAHEREIVKLAVGLGFSVGYSHYKAHMLVESEEKIIEISARAGFSETFYFEAEELMISTLAYLDFLLCRILYSCPLPLC